MTDPYSDNYLNFFLAKYYLNFEDIHGKLGIKNRHTSTLSSGSCYDDRMLGYFAKH